MWDHVEATKSNALVDMVDLARSLHSFNAIVICRMPQHVWIVTPSARLSTRSRHSRLIFAEIPTPRMSLKILVKRQRFGNPKLWNYDGILLEGTGACSSKWGFIRILHSRTGYTKEPALRRQNCMHRSDLTSLLKSDTDEVQRPSGNIHCRQYGLHRRRKTSKS